MILAWHIEKQKISVVHNWSLHCIGVNKEEEGSHLSWRPVTSRYLSRQVFRDSKEYVFGAFDSSLYFLNIILSDPLRQSHFSAERWRRPFAKEKKSNRQLMLIIAVDILILCPEMLH